MGLAGRVGRGIEGTVVQFDWFEGMVAGGWE